MALYCSCSCSRSCLKHRADLSSRLRTAKSLRVFDVVSNAILGRPSGTAPLQLGHTGENDVAGVTTEGTSYRAQAVDASYDLTAVLDAAITKSTQAEKSGLDAAAAGDFVQALRQRSRTFPAILRQQQNTSVGLSSTSPSRYMTIGNAHVAGVYYFSVILVTRHFLIQHVMPQLCGDDEPRAATSTSTSPQQDTSGSVRSVGATVTELADACIEAAIYMAQMFHHIMESESLLGNMCIVK
jgi:hypothetical protein